VLSSKADYADGNGDKDEDRENWIAEVALLSD
jgi:hypothetical protein